MARTRRATGPVFRKDPSERAVEQPFSSAPGFIVKHFCEVVMNKDSQNSPTDFLNTERGKSKSQAIETPSINLPKGGGAIKGIDEKFSVNAVNGTSSFSIPLPVANARGAVPNLTLAYNSGAGNGLFGLGWSLDLPSIKRKTDQELPQYIDEIDSDTFLFSETEDLVPEFRKENDGSFSLDANGDYVVNETDSPDGLSRIRFYRPRIEGLFARIERWQEKASGEIKWRVISKDNFTTLYGWSAESRISDPDDGRKIYEWLPEFAYDDKGNCVRYVYLAEDEKGFDASLLHNKNRFKAGRIAYANRYLKKVLYGNKTPYKAFGDPFNGEADFLFRTVFDFGDHAPAAPCLQDRDWPFRADAFSEYKSGFEIRTTRLCRRVLLYHFFAELPEGTALIKALEFAYDTASQQSFTFLQSVTARGYIKKPDNAYTDKTLPPLEFEYRKPEWNRDVRTIAPEDLVHSPAGLGDSAYQFTDLFNEGLAGILSEHAGGWFYKHNLGDGRFARAQMVSPKPSFGGLGNALQLADLDADGGKQLVSYTAVPRGFFELDDDHEWHGFRAFESVPNIDLRDPNLRMLDLDGDGLADALITEENVFTWYPSSGRKGFSAARKTPKAFDEELGPHVIFAEPTQTVFLADMKGDGLTDIVRIRNGEVCYWPNLGYGKFGAKVAMDNAPRFDRPELFDPAKIRLADIDGSGTADIIYLGENKFSCRMNLNGNAFAETPFEIDPFPEIFNSSQINVLDLLGTGVACIVWSSNLEKHAGAALRYIDLMNSRKPHLMTRYLNNLGKEISIEYTPSTRFYLEDKLAGRPWATKLHFPVHCISKTATVDRISGCRFASSYKYHHGYFDHPEREFRGFGMVEQTDTEDFEHWVKGDASNIVEEELHQAPVVVKSWFHTGAFLRHEKILGQFADGYWHAEMARAGFAVANPETPLPDARIVAAPGIAPAIVEHLSARERREAVRACKGMSLRTETFAKDAPPTGASAAERQKELTPFNVAAHNCVIELLQPKGKNKHAVFVVRESEAVTYSYERETGDPRIAHSLNIRLDQYGNILESAAVVYPRMFADLSLPAETRAAQSKTLVTYAENKFTNDVAAADTHRLRLPSEAKTYELKGVSKTGPLYAVSDFANILAVSAEVAYHQIDAVPPAGTSQKRLIEHLRTTFYNSNLSGALPLGQLAENGLAFEKYQLAYTPALVSSIFGTKVNAALLLDGKFTHSEADDNWWVRSGTIQYLDAGETLADAEDRFFQPVSFTDPYQAKTRVKYFSNYFLLIEETEDAAGNKSSVDLFNFRTLSAQRMRDINDNLSEAISDELGFVKATAVMGKGAEADELTGLTDSTDGPETAAVADFFDSADSVALTARGKALLGRASTRFVYDLDAYRSSGGTRPAVAAAIVREEHFNELADSPVRMSFEYSNGLGQVVMKKSPAEPGRARQTIINPDDTYTIIETDTSASVPPQLRWIGNGRTVLNNKGNPVKQFEPYFSVTHRFEDLKELVETGVTPILYYDAAGRLVETRFPNETFSRTEFDSWKQLVWDQNDTVADSPWYQKRYYRLIDAELIAAGKDPGREKLAAEKAAKHATTPMALHFDTLGRPVLQIEHNKDALGGDLFYQTKTALDPEGNLLSVVDARGNTVMTYRYDMLGGIAYQRSMDAGQRWLLKNILGNPLKSWDERNHEFLYGYDILHRPTEKRVTGGDGPVPLDNLYERITYGEALPDAALKNLKGRAVIIFDTAGKLETEEFDFKGNPLRTTRKFARNYRETVNWNVADPELLLESETFLSGFEYDAMNRVKSQTAPDGTVFEPHFNEAGLLESADVTQNGTTEPFVKNIDYDEKSQRTRIVYGNDVTTNYFYDQTTFLLRRLETKRQNGDPLQDLYYTFDAVGNITHLEDKNIPEIFFNNQKITGLATYTYDALYRLIEATGREHTAPLSFGLDDNWRDLPFLREYAAGNPMEWRVYTQRYEYDGVGNIEEMSHSAPGNTWVREYDYAAGNNRLLSTSIGLNTYNYAYHPEHGFIVSLPHLTLIKWNFKEELQATSRQSVNAGTPETTWYVYDGQGQRVRKITDHQAGAGVEPARKSERIYVAGIEVYREFGGGAVTLERETYHVMDDKNRIAMIETRTAGSDDGPLRLVRYQFASQLASAVIETDQTARVISYEEYHPFGTTSYQAVDKDIRAAAKRYRYTGMERDEESGLEYHSARYYLPWLGRWLSSDPSGLEDGVNLYAYARNRVIVGNDTNGKLFWFVVAAVLIGAAIGAGIETARQLSKPPEEWQWSRVGAAAAGGAVAGFFAGITGGASLGWQVAGVAVGSALGGVATRTINNESTTAGDVAWDVSIGLLTFGLLRGAGAVWGRVRPGSSGLPASGAPRSSGGRPGGSGGSGPRGSLTGAARAPRPQIPEGMTLNEFGRRLGWGDQMSPEASREAARNLGLEHFRRMGITPERARQWLAFYRDIVRHTPQNPSAAGRVAFFEEFVEMFARDTAARSAAGAAGSDSHEGETPVEGTTGPSSDATGSVTSPSSTSSQATIFVNPTPSPSVSFPVFDSIRSGSWLGPRVGSPGGSQICQPGVDVCIRGFADMPGTGYPPAYNPGTNSATMIQLEF
jgi:RHS repeat-associated protein